VATDSNFIPQASKPETDIEKPKGQTLIRSLKL
jgi:hypothetical protein